VLALAQSGGWLLRDGVWQPAPAARTDAPNPELVSYAGKLWLSMWSPATGIELSRLDGAAAPRD